MNQGSNPTKKVSLIDSLLPRNQQTNREPSLQFIESSSDSNRDSADQTRQPQSDFDVDDETANMLGDFLTAALKETNDLNHISSSTLTFYLMFDCFLKVLVSEGCKG